MISCRIIARFLMEDTRSLLFYIPSSFYWCPLISRLPDPLFNHSAASSSTFSNGILVGPFNEHSQTVRIRQPRCSSDERASASTSRFLSILVRQNLTLDVGHLNKGQSWPCQKQPCARTTALYLGKTMSGFPGRRLSWRRNRNPRENNPFRRNISGLVSFPRIPDIIRLRVARLTISAITQTGAAELRV